MDQKKFSDEYIKREAGNKYDVYDKKVPSGVWYWGFGPEGLLTWPKYTDGSNPAMMHDTWDDLHWKGRYYETDGRLEVVAPKGSQVLQLPSTLEQHLREKFGNITEIVMR